MGTSRNYEDTLHKSLTIAYMSMVEEMKIPSETLKVIFGALISVNNIFSLVLIHIDNLTWKLCTPAGEGPGGLERPSSFILQDKLYIYGGESKRENGPSGKDIFMLNFSKLFWVTQLF